MSDLVGILILFGGLSLIVLFGALLSRRWGRGSQESMSENMEIEASRAHGRSMWPW